MYSKVQYRQVYFPVQIKCHMSESVFSNSAEISQ